MQLYDKTGKTEINPNTLASLVILENGKTVEEVLKSLPTNEGFKLTKVRYYSSNTTNINELKNISWDSWVENFANLNLERNKYIWAQIKTQYGSVEDSAYCVVYVRPTPQFIYNVTKTFGQGEDPETEGEDYLQLLNSGWTTYPQEIKESYPYSWGAVVNTTGKCGKAYIVSKYTE